MLPSSQAPSGQRLPQVKAEKGAEVLETTARLPPGPAQERGLAPGLGGLGARSRGTREPTSPGPGSRQAASAATNRNPENGLVGGEATKTCGAEGWGARAEAGREGGGNDY